MQWDNMLWLFGASTIKFMFAPLGGPALELSFMETYIACTMGAAFSSSIFFFSAEFFMLRTKRKRTRKYEAQLRKGIPVKRKKNFTRLNKFVISIKHSLGIYGTCFWAPLFLSIPVGSIVSAKFYGRDYRAFPLILIGISMNGAVITTIAYLFC